MGKSREVTGRKASFKALAKTKRPKMIANTPAKKARDSVKRERFKAGADKLGKLRPAFRRDGGTVTAGNASGINDGAAAVLVASEEYAKASGAPILAKFGY